MCTVLDRIENKGREEGRAEGIAQGKREGIAQGKQEGIAQGKLEGMTQIYYTKLHYSADQIAEELGTPVATIQELINGLLGK